MRFVSTDLETSGIDPLRHGVLEFGAVFADLANSFEPKVFQAWIVPDNFVWDMYCLDLHRPLIDDINRKIKDKDAGMYNSLHDVGHSFKSWLHYTCGVPAKANQPGGGLPKLEKVTAAGKNFGSFDLQFLLRTESFRDVFRHRSIDPTAYYTAATDEFPPDLKECKARAGLVPKVAHRALADAWDVVDLLQRKFMT